MACPSVEAAAAGIEPAKGRLTGACLYQHRPHRNLSQGGRIRTCALKLPELARCQASLHPGKVGAGGFEPPISCSRSTRVSRLPHAPISTSKHPAGVEPALPPWQGSRLPLHHGRRITGRIVKEQSTGPRSTAVPGLEPTSPHYGCGLLAALATSAFHSVGSEGLEPSPTWLRARHAASSTLIPCSCFSFRCLCARTMGAEGIEPSTWSL